MNLFQELCSRAAVVDLTKKEPSPKPKAADEEVIGVLSDDTKRLYVVFCEEGDKYHEFRKNVVKEVEALDHKPLGKARAIMDRLNRECYFTTQRYEAVKKIFWTTVEAEFKAKLNINCGTGIRKGWKVVNFVLQHEETAIPIILSESICRALTEVMQAEAQSELSREHRTTPSVN